MSATVWRYLLFGLAGWIGEILYTGVKDRVKNKSWRLSANTSLWMFPIYSLIAFLFEPVHNQLVYYPLLFRAVGYMLVFFGVELASGFLLKKLTGDYVWHYSSRFSLGGYIKLSHAPVWYVTGLLVDTYYGNIVWLSELLAKM
ncbi:MAG: hypothetical protein HYS22_05915 [Deltaproteobacteria bacterium]|nr:hypothetical protein [Deltaproteobacteria bacterium]